MIIDRAFEALKLEKSNIQLITDLKVTNKKLKTEISQRKQAEKVAQRGEARMAQFFEAAFEVIFFHDNGTILDVNPSVKKVFGYDTDEVIGRNLLEFADPESRQRVITQMKASNEEPYEVSIIKKDRSVITMDVLAKTIKYKDQVAKVVALRDITERKNLEETLSKSHRALTVLNQCNHALIHAREEQELLDKICSVIAKTSDYSLTGVAYIEHDERKTMRVLASAGRGRGYLQSIKVTWGQDELGCGPWGTAVKTGYRYVANDLVSDPRFLPWREAAIKYDFASLVTLPLKKHDGEVFGILAIYAPEPYTFDSDEVKLLEDLANNLSYGIISLRTEIERKQAGQALRKSEEQFRTLVSNLPGAVYRYVVEADQWRLAIISDEIGTISGYPASEFITNSGRSFASITHPDDVNLVTGKLSASITDHRSYEITYRILRASGEERWVSEKGQPFYDKDGHCGYLDGTIFDITARKLAEEEVHKSRDELELRVQERTAALSESEERFRSVSQSAYDAMISIDGFGKIIFWNQAATKMFGRSEAEVMGKTLAPLIVPVRFREAHAAGLKRVREGGEQHIIGKVVELIGLRADGTEFPIELSLSRWKSEKEVFFNAIVRDITDRKEAEAQLKKTKKQAETASAMVETTLQNMGQGILMADGQGNILVYNDQFLAYVGVTVEEAEACRTFEEYFKLGKKNFSEESIKRALHYARLGGTATYEMISISGMIIKVRQNPLADGGFVRTYTDITALKAAEENFRSLLESAPDAIVIVNSNGKIQLVNELAVKLFEWDKDELIGKLVENLMPKPYRAHRPKLMARYFKDPSIFPTGVGRKLSGVTKNGRIFPIEILLSPIETNKGIVVAAGIRDISTHKQAEKALKIAKQTADEANQAKSIFLANMSHELRTPLNAIIGYSEMLWDETKDNKELKTFSDDLQKIQGAGRHLLGMINDVLDLSKIEAGRLDLLVEPFSVAHLLNEVTDTAQPLVEKQNNTLEV
ncbi:MAG: PAS domain S-box protein, partial [Bacteroidetes bacterium]|nr:PAS domain S-box protein [Bacteroidota bacterium]